MKSRVPNTNLDSSFTPGRDLILEDKYFMSSIYPFSYSRRTQHSHTENPPYMLRKGSASQRRRSIGLDRLHKSSYTRPSFRALCQAVGSEDRSCHTSIHGGTRTPRTDSQGSCSVGHIVHWSAGRQRRGFHRGFALAHRQLGLPLEHSPRRRNLQPSCLQRYPG